MRYELTSFLHLVRGSHDVFSGKPFFEDLKMYKQGDTSSAILCQTVKIFPGHPGLWFSLVIPSIRWQQRNELTGTGVWGRELLWGEKCSSWRKTLLWFWQGWVSDPAAERWWLSSKGIHIAKRHKISEITALWDCPLWLGRCAWVLSKGYRLRSNP